MEFIAIGIRRKGIGLSNIKISNVIFKLLKHWNCKKVITIMPKANLSGRLAARIANVEVRMAILTGNLWLDKKGIKKFFSRTLICW